MFERFKQSNKPLYIPHSSDKVYVTSEGKFFHRGGLEITTYTGTDGRLKLECNLYCGKGIYDAAVCMALAFKGTHLHFMSYVDLDVMFADGNSSNIHPSNLVWRLTKGKFQYRKDPEFAYIPGLTRYVVNKQGVLIDTSSGDLIKPHFENGYAKFKLCTDVGEKISIGRHRVVALAWLEYPNNVDGLVVNHIDGIPGNDDVGNLEFIDRAENNKHAAQLGLLRKGRQVLMRDVLKNTVQMFSGTSSCARALGLNRATIKFRLGVIGQPVWPGGFQFKYKHDPAPWREVLECEYLGKELHIGVSTPIYSRDIITGEVIRHDSIAQASNARDIPVMTIHHHLKSSKSGRPLKGYVFRYTDGPWPVYCDDALQVLRAYPSGRLSACYVTNTETGLKVLYNDIHETAKAVGRTTMAVNWGITTGKLVAEKFKITRFVLPSESLL